ncbi:MAG: MTH1187 family thiamine-binding protein [Symbiobacteriia bacterium]
MCLAEVSIVPVGTNDASFSSFVAEATKVADQMGVKYQITPTATVLEGDLHKVLNCAQQMHSAAINAGATRVVTSVVIDERRDKSLTMEDAISSVNASMH